MTVRAHHPMWPRPHRVRSRWRESHDTVTLSLEPLDGDHTPYEPGQFNMLYAFGVGEVPISISGRHGPGQPILHTIRAVGAVSRALCEVTAG